MNCTQIRESMPDLAIGLAEPSAEMRQHLETCAACATQLQEFRQTMALLDEWEAPEPSPYFHSRLQARLREEKAVENARAPRGWFAWLSHPAFAVAAAVLVAIGVGVFTTQHKATDNPIAVRPPVIQREPNLAANMNGVPVQRGTAVADLQTLDSDNDLYADFDVLDDIDSHQTQPTSE